MFLLQEKSGGAQLQVYSGCAILVSHKKRWGSLERKQGSLGVSVDVGMKTVLKLHVLFSSSSPSANPFDSPSNRFPTPTTFLQDHQEARVQEAPFLFCPKRHHPHRLYNVNAAPWSCAEVLLRPILTAVALIQPPSCLAPD